MQNSGLNIFFEGTNFLRMLGGLWVTVRISVISVLLSIVLGIAVGMVMTVKNPITKAITRVYLDFVRIMPQLVLLFIVYFGVTTAFNVNFSGELSAVIVFTFWGTAEMGDLVRGALISVPKHQYESGAAIGLSVRQIYCYIIIPQTVRHLIPLSINLTTRMIKTTSLVTLIGVIEVLKVGQQIIETSRFTYPSASLWIYGMVFFMYFIVCYPISWLAKKLEKKWRN